jgi:hypothetical protein
LRRLGRNAWLDAQLSARLPLPPELQARVGALSISQRDLRPPWWTSWSSSARPPTPPGRCGQGGGSAGLPAGPEQPGARGRQPRPAAGRSPNQLQEQLTWFWFNHFNIHQYKHNLRAMVGDYEQGLRTRALGRFRDLLGYTVHHPAMLRYLDNEQNAVGRLNENYARELLELHTLGVDAGYSQRDVQELARVLTGLGSSSAAPNLGSGPPCRPSTSAAA